MLSELSPPIAAETVNVETTAGEPRVDSRKLAGPLGIEHRYLFRLLRTHEADFAELGLVRFENAAVKTPGARGAKHVRYAMLTEDQAYLLLTYAKNTPEARRLKTHLVVTFRRARDAAEGRLSVDRASWDHALAVVRDEASARERGRIGGHLLSKWRHEKPAYESAVKSLQVEMQLVLPWSPAKGTQ
jgi:phage regulator Rha-like protein